MSTERILIMGLPGAGKTVLAIHLEEALHDMGKTVTWYNADRVREYYNDWDFSEEGRLRQARRMRELADAATTDYVIADFVAPLPEMRDIFDASWTIWMDTIISSSYEDTNKAFVRPTKYDFHFGSYGRYADSIAHDIVNNIRKPVFDWKKETVQMLGRWQPWHEGHRALFERAIAKTGQVVIQIRDCQGWNGSNPFELEEVKRRIRLNLDADYQGQYEIQVVPNIVNITYGRDVGYVIEQEVFDDNIHNISATDIRKKMGFDS